MLEVRDDTVLVVEDADQTTGQYSPIFQMLLHEIGDQIERFGEEIGEQRVIGCGGKDPLHTPGVLQTNAAQLLLGGFHLP